MHLSERILGKHAVETLQNRVKTAVLTIGGDSFTRTQLANVACFNYTAATILSNLLSQLKVKDTRDVFQNVAPGALALPGLGVISLATLGAAFELKKCGTLLDYIEKHQAEGMDITTFNTLKHNVADVRAAKEERKSAKYRKHSRANRAQNLRAERHIARHSGTKSNGANGHSNGGQS